MTGIVQSGIITKALPYQFAPIAAPMNLCRQAQEGLKTVGLQFLFNRTTMPNALLSGVWAYIVDTNISNPTLPLSQICSMFIDATGSANPIIIYFPDTGYEINVNAGSTLLAPVITSSVPPRFVVIDEFARNALHINYAPNDIVNIQLLNQFIPEFSTSALSSGNKIFADFLTTSDFNSSGIATLSLATKVYVTGIFAKVLSGTPNTPYIFQIQDGSVANFILFETIGINAGSVVDLVLSNGFNIITQDAGLYVSTQGTLLSGDRLYLSVYGGVLIQ